MRMRNCLRVTRILCMATSPPKPGSVQPNATYSIHNRFAGHPVRANTRADISTHTQDTQTDGGTDARTDNRQADKQIDKQIDKPTDKQIDKQIDKQDRTGQTNKYPDLLCTTSKFQRVARLTVTRKCNMYPNCPTSPSLPRRAPLRACSEQWPLPT